MMPGDSQSNKVAIAADATIGKCQNCSVLHQSLSEYVASLLALKQKIKASDDSVRLQQQLEELQIKLVTLEKKTADYDSVQAELEEKKDALKAYGQMSEELDKLRQENSKTTAEKEKLEEQLKDVKELAETQSLENAQLRREKAMIENDLLKTQASLKKSQAQADQVEKLNAENTKIISIKNDLENKIKMLKDSACKQNVQIAELTKEKILQERNIDDLKVRLIRLERERNKDHRSASTQANTPKEPKVDKEKFRMLLENLWACVEPQQSNCENRLLLPEPCPKQVPPASPRNTLHSHLSKTSPPATPKIRKSLSNLMQSNATCTQLKPADEPTPIKHQAHLQSRATKKQTDSPKKSKRLSKDHKTEESSADLFSSEVSFEEIRALFKPMAPCISPIADLETEIESMETDGGEKEHQPKPVKEESLLNTTSESSHCPKSAAPAEENMDLPVSASQVIKDISSGNDSQDLGQKELSGITKTEDKRSTDVEEIHAEEDLQIELKPETEGGASSSPSTSDVKDLVEAESLPPESQEPACSINPDSNCETENATLNKKEDQLESVSKMEVDVSPCNDKFGETVTAETLGSIDVAVTSEQAGDRQPVSSSPKSLASTETTGDAEEKNTEKSSEINSHEESHSFGQDSQAATVSVPQETDRCLGQDTDVQEEKPCASVSSDSVSNENAGERLERKVCVTSKEEQSIKVEQCEVKNADSSLESNRDDIKLSQLKMEEEEVTPGSKSSQEDLKTPSKKDVDKEALESSRPDSPQQEAINCKSLEDETHSYCRRLSPTCLFPTIKLLSLETNPTPKKLNFSDNIELTSSSQETPQPVPSLEEEGVIEKGEVKDSPSDSKQPSKRRGRKCKSVSPAASSKQGAAAKKEQNKCTESSRNQSPHVDREEEPRLVKGSAKARPEFIGQVRFEMGPPLPRLLTPLSTPPKAGKLISPRHAIGRLSFPSPMDRLASPTTPTQANLTPTSQQPGSASLNSPVHPNGVPSSPLQFGSATPKHAVPVPGRLPSTAVNSSPSSSSSSPSQENSVRMLDTMYPELSAHARTLSILRGNVSLGICSPGSGTSSSTSISQMSSFKTVNSTSTAFTKTETRGEKRQSTSLPEPNNGKCPKLDDCSPAVSCTQVPSSSPNSGEGTASPQPLRLNQLPSESHSPAVKAGEHVGEDPLVSALKRIEDQCFDLLPVVQSHQYVGSIPKKPILRDEEKEVIYEICQNSTKADEMLSAILHKLKAERRDLNSNYMQALCRVYTGICRQRGDWEKVRILAYSILTEDFQDPAKLILFMVTTWPNVLSHKSSLCEAIHAVTKAKAQENLLRCLSAFLKWEKTPPCDIDDLISRTLSNMKSGSNQAFTKHSRYGYDPGVESWEHIYTLHLLCTQKKWSWTYDNILGKELWPLMNTWVAQPRDQQAPISDTTVATVLRLIGLLGQLGIAERCASSVVTVANVINTFGSHGPTEGVPWEVQLAAVYCIYDLSPCNPKQALGALAEWRGETSQSVPPAVTSCINQLASVCRHVKN